MEEPECIMRPFALPIQIVVNWWICDQSQTRMDYANRMIKEKFDHEPIPTYNYLDFETMVQTEKPDVIIVTSVDRTHDEYNRKVHGIRL